MFAVSYFSPFFLSLFFLVLARVQFDASLCVRKKQVVSIQVEEIIDIFDSAGLVSFFFFFLVIVWFSSFLSSCAHIHTYTCPHTRYNVAGTN